MNKREFVLHCGELLRAAKPHLISTEYMLGSDIVTNYGEAAAQWNRIISDAEYAVVTCENGHYYFIDITANSLIAIAVAIFEVMTHK